MESRGSLCVLQVIRSVFPALMIHLSKFLLPIRRWKFAFFGCQLRNWDLRPQVMICHLLHSADFCNWSIITSENSCEYSYITELVSIHLQLSPFCTTHTHTVSAKSVDTPPSKHFLYACVMLLQSSAVFFIFSGKQFLKIIASAWNSAWNGAYCHRSQLIRRWTQLSQQTLI